MDCPGCHGFLPPKSTTCDHCGWSRKSRDRAPTEFHPASSGWVQCAWTGSQRCQLIGTIHTPSGHPHGYCTFHYACLTHPEWARDRAMFDEWWRVMQTRYNRPIYTASPQQIWLQLHGQGTAPNLTPFTGTNRPEWAYGKLGGGKP